MNARLLVAITAALVGCGTPRPLWLKHRANVAFATDPVVTLNQVVYLGVGRTVDSAKVIAVDRARVIWSVPTGALVRHLAVSEKGRVYAATDREVLTID
ncbi:hypothetical protein [Sorangium sp. So ce1000]|uniref:hypothetical protein n=1 Tax=Sorangium sp. So ce1000 TaxID=3133325 RepID=UPI003F62F38E